MFKCFFPIPKVFFPSAIVWIILCTIIWFWLGEDIASLIGINFQDSDDRCFHALQLIYPGGVQKGTLGLVGDKCKQIPHPAKAQGVASDRKEAQNNIKEQILEQVRNRKCLTFLICCLYFWIT